MDITLLQQYIRKTLSRQDEKEIQWQRSENTKNTLLLDLVDACMKPEYAAGNEELEPLSDDQIELLMIRLLSFNIKSRDAALFLHGVQQPLFYEKVRDILLVAATPESNFPDEVPEIRIQTTDEIFRKLRATASSKSIWQTLFEFMHSFSPTPLSWRKKTALGAALVSAAVVMFLFMVLPLTQTQHPIYKKYFTESEQSNLLKRSALSELQGQRHHTMPDSLNAMDSLKIKYNLAFTDYLNGQFQSSLNKFKSLESIISQLDESEKNAYLQSEFKFYIGLCHLNLAGSTRQQKQHLAAAIENLSKSLAIAHDYNFQHQRQVPFFLALAYDMNDENDRAASLITQFSIDSQYQHDAEQFLHSRK